MSPLTIEEKLIYRTIKRAAIVWLLLLRLDPQPITETTAADILQIDRTTARKHLKSLSEIGICTRLGRYNGFILTQTGRQLALPTELENGKGRISPSNVNAFNEGLNDSESVNPSLLLINGEGENLPFEGEFFPFDDGKDETPKKTNQPVDNSIKTVDNLIDELIQAQPEKTEILNALLDAGIAMNARTIKLLYSDNITPHDIKSQFTALKSRGMEDQTGILIVNLESKFRAKGADIDPDTGHKSDCRCNLCVQAWNKRYYEAWNND